MKKLVIVAVMFLSIGCAAKKPRPQVVRQVIPRECILGGTLISYCVDMDAEGKLSLCHEVIVKKACIKIVKPQTLNPDQPRNAAPTMTKNQRYKLRRRRELCGIPSHPGHNATRSGARIRTENTSRGFLPALLAMLTIPRFLRVRGV